MFYNICVCYIVWATSCKPKNSALITGIRFRFYLIYFRDDDILKKQHLNVLPFRITLSLFL